jgi:hypothetical protein
MESCRLRTFLLYDPVLLSSALLFGVAAFAIGFVSFAFTSSVTGCDAIRVERLGADSSPSVTVALRGGIIVVVNVSKIKVSGACGSTSATQFITIRA